MSVIKLPKFNVQTEAKSFLLEAGNHSMEVKEVRKVTVKNGKNAGKPALNVGLATEDNVWVWKQLPMWALAKTAPKNEKDWFRMSTVAFLEAIGHEGDELDIEGLVGKKVTARVGIQNNGDAYGDQNFIVTFVK